MAKSIAARLLRLERLQGAQRPGLAVVVGIGLAPEQIEEEVALRRASLPVGQRVMVIDR